jgi:regulator of protease activity HflC (stomatin/prohibitin superfamily)
MENTPYTALTTDALPGKSYGGESKYDDNNNSYNNDSLTRFSNLTKKVKSTVQEYEFDVGTVDMIKPDERLLTDPRLSAGKHTCESTCVKWPLLALSAVFPCYALGKVSCIKQNQIGVVTHMMGGAHILPSGCHISGCCTTVKKFEIKQDLIRNGNMWIIRILPGQYGLAISSGKPLILLPGRHAINDPLFDYVGSESVNEPMIEHRTIRIITVPRGKVGLVMVKGTGYFLQPGRHFVNQPNLKWIGMKNLVSEYIAVGSKHRIVIPAGKIGLAWDNGKPVILEHGDVYNISSPYFKYVKSVNLTAPVIVHGAIKIITVREGVFGVSYDDGVMRILQPGRHNLVKGTHTFAGFVPSGQTTLAIEAVTSMSADNVGIKFDSALTIQVSDPKAAVRELGTVQGQDQDQQTFLLNEFYANIKAKAKLALSIIIGNNKLNQSFESTQKKPITVIVEGKKSPNSEDPEEEVGTSFKQHVHDVFMNQFTTNMECCGIKVIDMSIEDVEITNEMLAKAMARGAVAATDLEKTRLEQVAAITAAEGKSKAMNILATAEANRIKTLDEAMSKVSGVTQQRELIRSAGEVIGQTKSTLILAENVANIMPLLGRNGMNIEGALNGSGK